MPYLDEFKDVKLDLSDIDFNNPEKNSASVLNGIDNWQRYVMTNFMDTQPKKRQAYLKRLGYEMNPKNPNEYRPIGFDGNWAEIDPEPKKFLGFIPLPDLFSEDGIKELMKDFGDIGWDAVEGVPLGMATLAGAKSGGVSGAGAGATVGSMFGPAGTGAGTTIGSILGAFGGGAAAASATKATSEMVKSGLADFFLDEDVPLDTQKLVYDSLLTGVLSSGFAGVGKMWTNWGKMNAEGVTKSLKEMAIRKSNGTFNQNLVDNFAQNPNNYTPEAVEGATKRLLGLRDEIFGTSAENPYTTRQLTGGVAGGAISKLNKRADLEIEKLAQLDEANFTVEELVNVVGERLQKYNKTFNTKEEIKAAEFLKDELERVMKRATEVPSGTPALVDATGKPFQQQTVRELSFKEGRDLLKSWQGAAFEDGPLKNNPVLKNITRDFRELADKKATALGSDLAEINAKRSEVLKLYGDMQRAIKDGSMQNAYVGKDSVSKQNIQRIFDRMDSVLNIDLGPTIERAQFQSAVERLYNSPAAFGSGSVVSDFVKGGLEEAPKQAFRFGTLGAVGGAESAGVAGMVGAAKGFVQGGMRAARTSSPEDFQRAFLKQNARIDKLEKMANPEDVWSAAKQGAKPALRTISPQLSREVAEDEFLPIPPEGPVQSAQAPQGTNQGQPAEADYLDEFRNVELDLSDLGLE